MKQKNILIFIIIFIIIFVIFAIYCNNYSSFGATALTQIIIPIGTTTYTLVLKDIKLNTLVTSTIPLSINTNNTVLVTGYKDGIISYTLNGGAEKTIQTIYNTIPSQTSGLYTLNNQTTNCISQYDADRRGVALNDLVSNTCKAAGFPGENITGSNVGCLDSGTKYICNGNVLSKVTFNFPFTIMPTITYTLTDIINKTSPSTTLIVDNNGVAIITNFPSGGYITITLGSSVIYYYGNNSGLTLPSGSFQNNSVVSGGTYYIPYSTINVSVASNVTTVTL